MSIIDFSTFLPDENSDEIEKAKSEAPYNLLIEYAKAVTEKYSPKLRGIVTERSYISHVGIGPNDIKENLLYSFSFEAAIGRGYLYRLLEIEQLTSGLYPVKVNVFRDYPSELGTYKTFQEFRDKVLPFLNSAIVKTIILNLIAQVELYNESRNEKFDWEDDIEKK